MTKTEKKNIAANSKAELARTMLRDRDYRCINGCPGPEAAKASYLEFWAGPKGLLILQVWDDDTVTTLCEWGLGQTWDEFANALGRSAVEA